MILSNIKYATFGNKGIFCQNLSNLSKLTKSLENEKHHIDIGFRQESSKSTETEKQKAMKIDKDFSM